MGQGDIGRHTHEAVLIFDLLVDFEDLLLGYYYSTPHVYGSIV